MLRLKKTKASIHYKLTSMTTHNPTLGCEETKKCHVANDLTKTKELPATLPGSQLAVPLDLPLLYKELMQTTKQWARLGWRKSL